MFKHFKFKFSKILSPRIICNNFNKNLTVYRIIMKEIVFSRWRRSMTMHWIKAE